MAIEIVIDPVPNTPTPTILIGFHNGEFSQAVYLQVDTDPLKCVEMANNLAEAFVNACGAAVKAHKEKVPETLRSVPNAD